MPLSFVRYGAKVGQGYFGVKSSLYSYKASQNEYDTKKWYYDRYYKRTHIQPSSVRRKELDTYKYRAKSSGYAGASQTLGFVRSSLSFRS